MTNYEIIRDCLQSTIEDLKDPKSMYANGYLDAFKAVVKLMDDLDRFDKLYEELKRVTEVIE